MRVTQSLSDLAHDPHGVIEWELPLNIEEIAQGPTFDERHYVEEHAVLNSGIVERQDVGMSKARRGFDLAEKAVRANSGRQLRP